MQKKNGKVESVAMKLDMSKPLIECFLEIIMVKNGFL